MQISHYPLLRKEISKILDAHDTYEFPVVLTFDEGMEFPSFKITIEKQAKDYFIDKNGVKWIKEAK